MDYDCPVNEFEQQLKEAGEQLALPPSSTKDLLHLLDKIEQLLTFVGQAPSISMQAALVPSMGALIGDELIKHSDVDVRVSVASCLCEVARITAPEPPYKDEIMKEIFQLNVMAFAELSNLTVQSYDKAIHILESVAKVKSCLLMLDLECDALVLEMFEQFLSKIRINHPHTVFSDMETIMTLVIEESDEIAPELLSLLVSHVRKENQNNSPASWNLAEKVLRNCNGTLKSYSETITKLVNSDPDNYAQVVTLLCQHGNGNKLVVTKSTTTNIRKRGRPKNLVSNSQEDTRTRFRGKSKGIMKKEDEILSDYNGVEPLMQEINNNNKEQSKRKPSSKKRVVNGSREKDTPKIYKQELVGHRIKVWWPLDQVFYKGVVSSYNPLDDKYKVLYADGDEELLDLRHEKWRMLDLTSPDQEQVADLPTPITTTTTLATPAHADSSKTEPKGADSSTMNILCNVDKPNPSGELEERKLPESTEMIQRLEKTENLVCEILSDM